MPPNGEENEREIRQIGKKLAEGMQKLFEKMSNIPVTVSSDLKLRGGTRKFSRIVLNLIDQSEDPLPENIEAIAREWVNGRLNQLPPKVGVDLVYKQGGMT